MLFVMQFVHGIGDASFQAKRHSTLILATGQTLRLRTSFHWHMKVTGFEIILVDGLQSRQLKEDLSIQCKMAYCLKLGSINYLTPMVSQSILMYVFYLFRETVVANSYYQDNYKVMFFVRDGKNIAGRHLDQRFLDHPDRPVDELFRWHFRQAVLANMRGLGEPFFEHDYPPGSNMVGEILEGPMADKRMEFELFSRLGALQDV